MKKKIFMIIEHSSKPTKEDGKIEHREMAHFVDSVPKKMNESATYIFDLLEYKLVKNRFDLNTDDELIPFYIKKYLDKVNEAVKVYKDKYKNNNLIKEFEEKLANEFKKETPYIN